MSGAFSSEDFGTSSAEDSEEDDSSED